MSSGTPALIMKTTALRNQQVKYRTIPSVSDAPDFPDKKYVLYSRIPLTKSLYYGKLKMAANMNMFKNRSGCFNQSCFAASGTYLRWDKGILI